MVKEAPCTVPGSYVICERAFFCFFCAYHLTPACPSQPGPGQVGVAALRLDLLNKQLHNPRAVRQRSSHLGCLSYSVLYCILLCCTILQQCTGDSRILIPNSNTYVALPSFEIVGVDGIISEHHTSVRLGHFFLFSLALHFLLAVVVASLLRTSFGGGTLGKLIYSDRIILYIIVL